MSRSDFNLAEREGHYGVLTVSEPLSATPGYVAGIGGGSGSGILWDPDVHGYRIIINFATGASEPTDPVNIVLPTRGTKLGAHVMVIVRNTNTMNPTPKIWFENPGAWVDGVVPAFNATADSHWYAPATLTQPGFNERFCQANEGTGAFWTQIGGPELLSSGGTDVAVYHDLTLHEDALDTLRFSGDGVTVSNPVAGEAVVTIPGGGGSDLAVLDEGVQKTAAATSMNFVGSGVTATNSGDAVTVTIPGGGGGGTFLDLSDTPSSYSGTTGLVPQSDGTKLVFAAVSGSGSYPLGGISVTDAPYNAVGNGTGNQAPALTAAFNAAQAIGVPLYIPAGVYRCTETVHFGGSSLLGTNYATHWHPSHLRITQAEIAAGTKDRDLWESRIAVNPTISAKFNTERKKKQIIVQGAGPETVIWGDWTATTNGDPIVSGFLGVEYLSAGEPTGQQVGMCGAIRDLSIASGDCTWNGSRLVTPSCAYGAAARTTRQTGLFMPLSQATLSNLTFDSCWVALVAADSYNCRYEDLFSRGCQYGPTLLVNNGMSMQNVQYFANQNSVTGEVTRGLCFCGDGASVRTIGGQGCDLGLFVTFAKGSTFHGGYFETALSNAYSIVLGDGLAVNSLESCSFNGFFVSGSSKKLLTNGAWECHMHGMKFNVLPGYASYVHFTLANDKLFVGATDWHELDGATITASTGTIASHLVTLGRESYLPSASKVTYA